MDTAWIQVFILSISECVAPAGKTVCQEQQFELEFLSQAHCEFALEQLVALKTESDKVIIDPDNARCTPSARQRPAFASLAEVDSASQDLAGWTPPESDSTSPDSTLSSHRERLDSLRTCEETGGTAPCKVGEIIMEAASPSNTVEVWRRDE